MHNSLILKIPDGEVNQFRHLICSAFLIFLFFPHSLSLSPPLSLLFISVSPLHRSALSLIFVSFFLFLFIFLTFCLLVCVCVHMCACLCVYMCTQTLTIFLHNDLCLFFSVLLYLSHSVYSTLLSILYAVYICVCSWEDLETRG